MLNRNKQAQCPTMSERRRLGRDGTKGAETVTLSTPAGEPTPPSQPSSAHIESPQTQQPESSKGICPRLSASPFLHPFYQIYHRVFETVYLGLAPKCRFICARALSLGKPGKPTPRQAGRVPMRASAQAFQEESRWRCSIHSPRIHPQECPGGQIRF